MISTAAKLAGLKIGGNVQGSASNSTGVISIVGDMGFVTIGGNLTGAGGNDSARSRLAASWRA